VNSNSRYLFESDHSETIGKRLSTAREVANDQRIFRPASLGTWEHLMITKRACLENFIAVKLPYWEKLRRTVLGRVVVQFAEQEA